MRRLLLLQERSSVRRIEIEIPPSPILPSRAEYNDFVSANPANQVLRGVSSQTLTWINPTLVGHGQPWSNHPNELCTPHTMLGQLGLVFAAKVGTGRAQNGDKTSLIDCVTRFFGRVGRQMHRRLKKGRLHVEFLVGDWRQQAKKHDAYDRVHLGASLERGSLIQDILAARALLGPVPEHESAKAIFCDVVGFGLKFKDFPHMLQCAAGIESVDTFEHFAAVNVSRGHRSLVKGTLVMIPAFVGDARLHGVVDPTYVPWLIDQRRLRPTNKQLHDFMLQMLVLAIVPPIADGRTSAFGARCAFPASLLGWLRMLSDLVASAGFPRHVAEEVIWELRPNNEVSKQQAGASIRLWSTRPVTKLPPRQRFGAFFGGAIYPEMRFLEAVEELAGRHDSPKGFPRRSRHLHPGYLCRVTVPVDMKALAEWRALPVNKRCAEDDPCLGVFFADDEAHDLRQGGKALRQLLYDQIFPADISDPDLNPITMLSSFSLERTRSEDGPPGVAGSTAAAALSAEEQLCIRMSLGVSDVSRLLQDNQGEWEGLPLTAAYLYETRNYTVLSVVPLARATVEYGE